MEERIIIFPVSISQAAIHLGITRQEATTIIALEGIETFRGKKKTRLLNRENFFLVQEQAEALISAKRETEFAPA